MAKVFISYSTRDKEQARAFRAWLRAIGCKDIFFAEHQTDGISPGNQWRDALRNESQRSKIIVLLISENWLASAECRREFDMAFASDRKRIIPVRIADCDPSSMGDDLAKIQGINLSDPAQTDTEYEKLKRILERCGATGSQRSRGRAVVALSLIAATIFMISFFYPDCMRFIDLSPEPSGPTVSCNDRNFHRERFSGDQFRHLQCSTTYLCQEANVMYRQEAEQSLCVLVPLAIEKMKDEGRKQVFDQYPDLIPFLLSEAKNAEFAVAGSCSKPLLPAVCSSYRKNERPT